MKGVCYFCGLYTGVSQCVTFTAYRVDKITAYQSKSEMWKLAIFHRLKIFVMRGVCRWAIDLIKLLHFNRLGIVDVFRSSSLSILKSVEAICISLLISNLFVSWQNLLSLIIQENKSIILISKGKKVGEKDLN